MVTGLGKLESDSRSYVTADINGQNYANRNPWEFWKSIGEPKYVLAPMVDLGDLAFRMLVRRYGAQLTYTPMLHSGQFSKSCKYREANFQICPEDHPIFAQFCGNDPDTVVAAALHVKDDVEAIDFNLGCPQGIARRGNYGAFLLEQPHIIMPVLKALKNSLTIPVSCKVRLVSKELQDTLNLCLALQANGCDIICIHGRTKDQKAQKITPCDWESIRIIKQRLDIPVIANGGIETMYDVKQCLDFCGVDAVMSAEGLLDYPALFSGNTSCSRVQLAEEYLALAELFPPFSKSCIKAHMFRLLYGHLSQNVCIRSRLAAVSTLYEIRNVFVDLKHEIKDASKSGLTWYRRHHDAVQT